MKVRDDGHGLNIARIGALALKKNLVPSLDHLSTREIANLVFQPGFSTKNLVTDTSGRGVGLDAIKAFNRSQGGDVFIEIVRPINDEEKIYSIEVVVRIDNRFIEYLSQDRLAG